MYQAIVVMLPVDTSAPAAQMGEVMAMLQQFSQTPSLVTPGTPDQWVIAARNTLPLTFDVTLPSTWGVIGGAFYLVSFLNPRAAGSA